MFDHFIHSFCTSFRNRRFVFLLTWAASFFFILVHVFLNFFCFLLIVSFHHLVFRSRVIFIKSSINRINIFVFVLSLIESFWWCLFVWRGRCRSRDFIRGSKESINVNNILKETPLVLNICLELIICLSVHFSQHFLFLTCAETLLLVNSLLDLLFELKLLFLLLLLLLTLFLFCVQHVLQVR